MLPDMMRDSFTMVEEQGYEKVFVRPSVVLFRVNIHGLVREPLHMINESVAHHNHYWWNRARPGAATQQVRDDRLWQRYGDRLTARVPKSALKRSHH